MALDGTGIGALNNSPGGEFGMGGSVSPVSEPETYAMLLAGLGLIGWVARHRKACKHFAAKSWGYFYSSLINL